MLIVFKQAEEDRALQFRGPGGPGDVAKADNGKKEQP